MAREGMAQHGTAVFTHEQTSGRGQRERSWQSQKDQNIAISFVLAPDQLPGSSIFSLNMSIANAVHQFLSRFIIEDLAIKWPNDIYWRDRKAAGILIENLWQGTQWNRAIAGIGININQTDFGDLGKKAVSIRQITGQIHSPLELAKELCLTLNDHLLPGAPSPAPYYLEHLYRKGQTVKFKKDSRLFEAVIKTVDENGRLVVQHAIEERFAAGDVEIRG